MEIYKIRNKISGRLYIGQTKDTAQKRWRGHVKGSKSKNKITRPILLAIKKYGEENFEVSIIVRCNNKAELDHRERLCVRLFNSQVPNGYNLEPGGNEHKTQHPDTKKRKAESDSTRRWDINPFLGKHHTEENKRIMSLRQKDRFKDKTVHPFFGKNLTNEHKGKISVARKVFYETNPHPRSGVILTEETKQKISKSHVGKIVPEEVREKISNSLKGEKNAMFGKHHTEESNNKNLLSQKTRVKILCLNNKVIYESQCDASKKLGLPISSISAVVRGMQNNVKGFVFKKV